jgi:predicted transposase/invertase (TIGR01784 family)
MEISRHDSFFKTLLEQPRTAGALLRERLPKEIVELLAPGEPELVDGTFIDPEFRETRTDRLYRMKLQDGGELYVYCVLEHKSEPDYRVPLQLLGYLTMGWQRFDRDANGRGKLPPVIALVVYHGKSQWAGPRSFGEMVNASPAVQRRMLNFPFEVLDLGPIPDAELSLDHDLRAGLMALKYVKVRPGELLEALVRVLESLNRASPAVVEVTLRYIVEVYPVDEATLSEALKRAMPEKEEEMLSIAAREWLKQGEAKGRVEGEAKGEARGRAEGRVEGRTEAAARLLMRALEHRFGPVPEQVCERVARAEFVQLEDWHDRAIDAPSLEAVFAPSAH